MTDMEISNTDGAPGVAVHFTILAEAGEVDGYVHLFLWTKGDVGIRQELIGTPRKLEITIARAGSIEHALLAAWAQSVTVGLEAGMPIAPYIAAVQNTRFEPSGVMLISGKPLEKRRFVTSVLDAVAAILNDLAERNWKIRVAEVKQTEKIEVIKGLEELVRRLTS